MKFIKKYIFVIIAILFVFITVTNVNAESIDINTKENNFRNLTDDDYFQFKDQKYTLKDYVNSIKGINNPQPQQQLYACNTSFYTNDTGTTIMEVKGDDPIVSLVPKELFKIPNISKIHIGKEYGFFIKTKVIDNTVYSNVYIFDIENDLQDSAPSHYKFIIKPLFQREYVYFEESVSFVKTQGITGDLEQGNRLYDYYLLTNINVTDVVAPIPYFAGTNGYFFAENKEVYLSNVKML